MTISRWRDTLLEVEPGVFKPASDCTPEDLDRVDEIQQEKDILSGRIEQASASIWAQINTGDPLPPLPAWWVFAPEIAWTDIVSMREAAPELERCVQGLPQVVRR